MAFRTSDTETASGEEVELNVGGQELILADTYVQAVTVIGAGLVGPTSVSVGTRDSPDAYGTHEIVAGALSTSGFGTTPRTFLSATHIIVRGLDGDFSAGTLQGTVHYLGLDQVPVESTVDDELVADLRTMLRDNEFDNYVKDKRFAVGRVTGSNRRFFTAEDRLICSGSPASYANPPFRVFWRGTEVAASGINVVNHNTGEVLLTFAPSGVTTDGYDLQATYFWRKWYDSELRTFLRHAANLVGCTAVTEVPSGLRPAVLEFAASYAHGNLAERLQQRLSQQLLLENQPDEQLSAAVSYHQGEANVRRQVGQQYRMDYQDGFGTSRRPAFGVVRRRFSTGRIRF